MTEKLLCLVCDHRLAEPDSLLCVGDYDELAFALAELAAGYARLDARPGAGGDAGGRGAPGFASRSPARDAVLVLTDTRKVAFDPDTPTQPTGIVRVVGWWADQARESGILPGRTGPRTVAGEVALLLEHLDAVAGAWWAPDMHEAVTAAVRILRRTLGELEPTIPIGDCPGCGARIRARSWGQRARCVGCGQRWEGEAELRALGELLGDAQMDAAGIARYCGVAVSTVRVWAHRDGWERIREGGRTLYRLADARASADARRTSSAGQPTS